MDREKAIGALRAAMPALQRRFGVRSLFVFGSLARGEATPHSDADVLVRFEPGRRVTLILLADLVEDLERRLGMRVDLVEEHPGLRPEFLERVFAECFRVA
jgi:predicted nucleotidyltransferase